MAPEKASGMPGSAVAGLNMKETELTLGLPGELRAEKSSSSGSGTKRGFSETVDLNLGSSSGDLHIKKQEVDESKAEASAESKPPAANLKAAVVGWPPVKRTMLKKSCKYVKVAVDGAPYLRKVDLETYSSYQQLLNALEDMFSCLTIRNVVNEKKLMDAVNGVEYVPTYEDKDGDWMLVGDVPWKMFVESCKRMRLMKSSEAIGLGPNKPPTECSNSGC